jgi:DNA-binding NarL/FixJ family response regulator
MKAPLAILLVDDNVDFLSAAAQFLAAQDGIRVVGRAQSGEEAIELEKRLQPDLILVDLAMPGMNGLEATRRLKAASNPPRVVLLTIHDNAEYRCQARAAGADGFVGKGDFGERLLPLIERLMGSPENGTDGGEA